MNNWLSVTALVMPALSFVVSFTTLVTFVKTRRDEAIERGVRQERLDSSITQLKDIVTQMSKQIVDQRKDLDRLRLWLELLLQQHQQNHGQDIRR